MNLSDQLYVMFWYIFCEFNLLCYSLISNISEINIDIPSQRSSATRYKEVNTGLSERHSPSMGEERARNE